MGEALKSYAGGEAASPTVVAHAKRLTLEAVKRYDPSQAKLRTHLLSHLRGIRRHVARSTSPIYYPEAHRMDAVRLTAVTNDLVDKLGRDPSDAEIADASGMDLRRISSARGVTGALAGGQVGDVVSVGARRDPAAWDNWLKIVYHDLDPVDQLILEHSFGMHGKPVLPANEIAGRVGLSGGAVSQRKARIQNVLDEYDMFMGHGG
jgi:DNA-directed RNA polymerase specialized sigma subunit